VQQISKYQQRLTFFKSVAEDFENAQAVETKT